MGLWLIFSDIHLDNYKLFATIAANGLNSRLMEQIIVLQQVKKIIHQNKITTTFFLGDLFNALSPTISKMIYNVAFYLIQSMAEITDIYLLPGNHDIWGKINLFTPFTSIPRVKVIDQTTQIELDGRTIDLIPWGDQIPIPEEQAEFCFGHFGIQGATIGDNFIAEEEIKPQFLKDYKTVLAGHYHTRQQVADNAYQIGSVMNTNFSNTTEDKGVFLLNPVNAELKFIPVPSAKFITVEINNENDIKEFIPVPENYYKVRIKQDGLQVPEYPNVIYEHDFEPTVDEKEAIDTADITNLLPIVYEYITNSNTSLDKNILKNKARELLEL